MSHCCDCSCRIAPALLLQPGPSAINTLALVCARTLMCTLLLLPFVIFLSSSLCRDWSSAQSLLLSVCWWAWFSLRCLVQFALWGVKTAVLATHHTELLIEQCCSVTVVFCCCFCGWSLSCFVYWDGVWIELHYIYFPIWTHLRQTLVSVLMGMWSKRHSKLRCRLFNTSPIPFN